MKGSQCPEGSMNPRENPKAGAKNEASKRLKGRQRRGSASLTNITGGKRIFKGVDHFEGRGGKREKDST